MTLTRTPLNRCSVKDCHLPQDEHYCWGWDLVPHDCMNPITHQHHPKKGMGGRNSKSEVVACLCMNLHDMVDNQAKFKNEVVNRNGRRYYRLWKPADEHKPDGWALVWKEIPDGSSRVRLHTEETGGALAGEGAEVEVRPSLAHGRSGDEGDDNRHQARKAPSFQAAHAPSANLQELSPDFGPDYLELPPEFTLQDAVPWAAMVGKWERGRQWYAGDFILQCEARHGEERFWGHQWPRCQNCGGDGSDCDEDCVDGVVYLTLPEYLGQAYQSLRNCQRVCQAFSPGERYPLSFGHHAAVYRHPERDRLMEQATAEGWTVSRLREAVSGHVEPAKHECPLCGAEHRVKEPMT